MGKRFSAIRAGAERVWERAHGWARSLVAQVRPRVSLASGSVLVVLTLFLPIAYEACGPERKGHEFIRGEGIWPGLLSFVIPWAERGFYLLALALALVTLLLVLISFRRPALLRQGSLMTALFAVTGGSSLYVIADFFWAFLWLWLDELRKSLEVPEDTAVAVFAALMFLVMVTCLRSKFLRGQRWIVTLFAVASLLSLTVVADFFLSLLTPYHLWSDSALAGMTFAPTFLYWLVPLVLWLRFGLFGRSALTGQWPAIRSRLILLYAPVVAIDCLFFAEVVKMGIWGFIPFFVGLQLISLGYMRLAREAQGLSPTEPSG